MADTVPTPEESKQQQAPLLPAEAPPVTSAVGRRQAFQDIKRQLTSDELKEPGTQKVILDLLVTTEAERDDYKGYVKLYYQADKKAGILEEKLKTNKVNEILFGVGVGVGGAVIGLAPFFWEIKSSYGVVTVAVGLALTVGATVGRIVFK